MGGSVWGGVGGRVYCMEGCDVHYCGTEQRGG